MGDADNPWEFSKGTRQVADFVEAFELESLPSEIESNLRRTVIDTLGAIYAGHSIREASIVVEYVKETFAEGDVTILDGSGDRSQIEGAIFSNCFAANALDIDEGNRFGDGHPAAVVVPVAMAVAEEQNTSIRKFLEAVMVGYEVAVRAGRARREVIEYHTGTGSWAPIGAAATACKLRDVDRNTLEEALGIADFNAPITPVMRSAANPGSGLTKDGVGWGGYVGITAVEMASRGLTASGTLFDDESVTVHEDLGEEYSFEYQYCKPYPTCRWTHPGIDAVRDLYEEHDIDPESIQSVDVYTFDHGVQLGTRNPTNADEAEYSYPYSLAVALINGDVTPADLHQEAISDEAISEMIDRINLHLDPDLEARYDEAWLAQVEIDTGDRTYSSEITPARGSPERPMTEGDFREKNRQLFEAHPDPDVHDIIAEMVSTPEDEVADLLDLWNDETTAVHSR